MAFKKYSYKGGKKYGPYLYENKRVGEKVVTRYVGKAENSRDFNSKFFFSSVFILAIALLLVIALFYFPNGSPTGFVSLKVQPQYLEGENLRGEVNFNFRAGELIPKDSKIVISLGSQEQEYTLQELIEESVISGEYYAEQKLLSGEGEGYGVIGEKISYPTLNFDLRIFKSEETQEESSEEAPSEETPSEETPEIPEESSGESSSEDSSQESTDSSDSSSDSSSESSSDSSSSSSDSSSDSGSSDSGSGDSGGDSSVTGEVISEDEFSVSGRVSKEEAFEYNLEEGQRAEIVSGSVTYNNTNFEDSLVNLKISDGKARVTTNYEVREQGFGRDYLGDFALTLSIDVGSVNITAEKGDLKVKLIYQDTILANSEEELNVIEAPKLFNQTTNETLTPLEANITELNLTISQIKDIPSLRIKAGAALDLNLSEYFIGAESYTLEANNITSTISGEILTLIPDEGFKGSRKGIISASAENSRDLESNEFNILVSSGNMSVVTSRGSIRVGEKVRWTQNITLETPENITLELPSSAENVVIKKEDERGELVQVQAENLEVAGASAGILSGNVIVDIELKTEPKIVLWFKTLLRSLRITGNVIQEEISAEKVEIIISEDAEEYTIEYETPAPTATETETSSGKEVVISAPDELGYTDVLSFTEIPEIFSVGQEDSIKIYWKENKSYVEFDAYDLDGNDMLDYVEWITPHLSNQTFEIILITKAEKLDENRTYVESVYEQVRELDDNTTLINSGEYLRVVFEQELDNTKDITIYARVSEENSDARVEVYEKDEDILLATFENFSTEVERKQILLTSLEEGKSQDTFDLKIVSSGVGVEFDYVVDPYNSTNTSIASCGVIEEAGTYTLSGNIGTGGTCINITADNVTIDGAGFSVTGNIDGSESAAAGHVNITLFNVTVVGTVSVVGGQETDAYGFAGGTILINNSNITSSVDASGGSVQSETGEGDGGQGGSITVVNSYTGVLSANGGGKIGACSGGNMGTGGTIVVLSSTVGNVNAMGASWNDCGELGGAGGNINITSSTAGDLSAYGGIDNGGGTINGGIVNVVSSSVRNINTVGGDSLYSNGGNGGAVYLTNSNSTTISAYGGAGNSGTGGAGATITISSSSTVSGDINAYGGDTSDGSETYPGGNGGNVNFTNSNLNVSATINLAGGACSSTCSSPGTAGTLKLNQSSVYNSHASVKFSYVSTQNTSLSTIMSLGNNSAYVNSSYTDYNKTANVTLYNIGNRGYSIPAIFKDGVLCGSSCYNFTSLTASTVVFNVSSWSNYSIGDIGSVSACGTLSQAGTYILTGNIGTGGTCINITADNVTIDGAGFTITGNISALKENDNAYTGLTLKNVSVTGNIISTGADETDEDKDAGSGGSVVLNNSVIVGNVNTFGGVHSYSTYSGGNAGAVNLTNSNISGNINAYGGLSDSSSGGTGGTGGTITISSSSSVGNINNYGGLSYGDSGAAGGAITISGGSTVGNINNYGGLTYDTTYSYAAGSGGTVNVTGSTVGNISNYGGADTSGENGGGGAGSGGAVYLTNSYGLNINNYGGSDKGTVAGSGGSVTLISSNVSAINSYSGDGQSNGGSGGTITLTNSNATTINVGAGEVYADDSIAGSITLNNSRATSLSAGGAWNTQDGTDGGTITLINSVVVSVGTGGGTGECGGGSGGTISLVSSNATTLDSGGGGTYGGCTGGTGGTITLTNSNANNINSIGGGASTEGATAGTGGNVIIKGTSFDLGSAISVAAGDNTNGGEPGVEGTLTINYTTSFDDASANYSNMKLKVINSEYGIVDFTPAGVITNSNLNGSLSSNIIIGNNSAYLNSTALSELNVSANITLYGTPGAGKTLPKIYKDGSLCGSSCYNFTSLAASTVVFNVSSWSTYTIGEGAAPLISYGIGTENAGELGAAPGSIYVNASVNSGGATLTNITFTLYNTSGVVNSTSYTGANALSVRTITWSVGQYAYDNYTYQVNVTGSNGLTNATDLRAIRFLPSCLDIGTCNETGNCVINTECYLFSSKCTNMSCDFANFTMGAGGRLYTLHDTATGNGMPLAINTSGSISFTVGSRVIFNGKNGSSISPGTVGGNASVINWTTSGLFNTTHGMFEGIGGYSTLTGVAGGNGGILQINAFGFIRQFDDALYYLEETDNMPLLNAGTSVSAIDGEEYNINTDNSLVANLPQDIPVPLFVKSLVCSPRIDVDVNGDGYVDFTDSDTIRNNYNTLSGESGFSDYYDINCDDKLNVKELARIGFEFERGA